MNKQRFIDAVNGYEGTRWHHQGRLPGVVLDCGGLVFCAAREAGGDHIEDMPPYKRWPKKDELTKSLRRYCDPVPLGSEEPGDIQLYIVEELNEDAHVAVLVAPNQIVHAYLPSRKVVRHHDSDAQLKRSHKLSFRPRWTS